MNRGRRVTYRASLIAASTDSVPDWQRKLITGSRIGASAASRSASAGHPLVPVIARDVQELRGRLLHRAHDLRMGVPRRADRDAGREIKKAIAVDVPDFGSAAMRHDERVVARIRRRAHARVARDHGPRLGSGQLGLQMNVSHGGFLDG
jgi:hypothetical protein